MTLTPLQEKAKLYCEALIAKYDSNIAIPGEDGKYHYIYLSYHKQTYKFYIGKHSSKSFSIDKYTGSGVWYGHALKHHGKDAFEHHRLAFFPTSDEAYAKEAEEVTLEMIENTFKGQIYNLKEGGKGGGKMTKEIRDRLAQAIRDGVEYTLKKDGISLEGVTRYELLPLLKEGWKITSHEQIRLHHAKVAGSRIMVSGVYKEADILHALEVFGEENFALGAPPLGHETTADEKTVKKVKKYIELVKKRWRQRAADSKRAGVGYVLTRGTETKPVNKDELIPLLQKEEGWKITSPKEIRLHHAKVAESTIQVKKETGFMEADILDAFETFGEEDCILGRAPQGHQTTADEKTVKKVKKYIELVRNRGRQRQADAKRASTRYTLKKGEKTLDDVTRDDVLGKLKEDYRFTQVSVKICNKAGKDTDYRFERNGRNLDRELQHLKLIRLLESGDWQIGMKWEEPVVVEEPVVAEIEELVEANPVVGEPVVQSAWGEMINFFDSFKDLPITRKTRYTI